MNAMALFREALAEGRDGAAQDQLHRAGPLIKADASTWLVTSASLAVDVMRNHDVFSSKVGSTPPLLTQDPPDHTQLRRLLQPWFTAKRADQVAAAMAPTLDHLILRAGHGRPFEAVAEIATPAAACTAFMILRNPDAATAREWLSDNVPPGTPLRAAMQRTQRSLITYLNNTAGADDLVSTLSRAASQGNLGGYTAEVMVEMLLRAGLETSQSLLTHILAALAESDHGLWRSAPQLREHVRGFVDQVVGTAAPVQFITRRVTSPVELAGHHLEPGDTVVVLLRVAGPVRGGADHDREVAFGFGVHYCIGRPFARALGEEMVLHIIRQYSGLQVLQTPVPTGGLVNAYAELKMLATARPSPVAELTT